MSSSSGRFVLRVSRSHTQYLHPRLTIPAAEYEWVATDIAKVVALVPSSVSLHVEVYLTGGKRDNALQGLPELELEKSDVDVEKDGVLTTTSSKERSSSRSSSNEKADVSGTSTPTKPTAAYFASGATTPTTACADGSFAFPRPGIVLKSGRPDVRTILEEEVTTSAGAVAVDGESRSLYNPFYQSLTPSPQYLGPTVWWTLCVRRSLSPSQGL